VRTQELQTTRTSTDVVRTTTSLTGVDAIFERIVLCRREKYATNCEYLLLGDMGIGAPIVNSNGQTVDSAHLSQQTIRWTMDEVQKRCAVWLSRIEFDRHDVLQMIGLVHIDRVGSRQRPATSQF
jgi:DNA-binding IclR family transcriptional regulator